MKNLQYIIKWILGYLTAVRYIRGKETHYLIWGHIGESVYSLSLIPEIKKYKGIDNIHLLVMQPYDQIADLYRDQFIDMKTMSIKRMGWLIIYSQSNIKFHHNIIGGGWTWTNNEYQAEVPETYIAGYCYNVLDLNIPYSAKHMNITTPISENDEKFQELVQSNKIQKEKAVLLIPYAQSAKEMEVEWWKIVGKHLIERGYQVFTNVKNDTEKSIEGTMPISIPLKYVPSVINYMGSCISIRCGLSDLIAVGNCNMEVIYRVKDKIDEGLVGLWSWKLGKDKALYTNKNVLHNKNELEQFLLKLSEKYPVIK